MYISEEDKIRFVNKVNVVDEDKCWEWQGTKIPKGYGYISIRGKSKRAHRISFELFYEKNVPKYLDVLHTCDNPSCVNPLHLFLGTNKDNVDDRNQKNRTANGERDSNCKLTDEQVNNIRLESKMNGGNLSKKELADKYGVNTSTVYSIIAMMHRKTPTNLLLN